MSARSSSGVSPTERCDASDTEQLPHYTKWCSFMHSGHGRQTRGMMSGWTRPPQLWLRALCGYDGDSRILVNFN